MDNSIRNVSELTEALNKMIKIEDQPTSIQSNQEDHLPQESMQKDNQQQKDRPLMKGKNTVQNGSTAGLLLNLAGINSTTNNKLDSLLDAITRLDATMKESIAKQDKQLDLLATIARNTVHRQNESSNDKSSSSSSSKFNSNTIKDYGFTTTIDVLSELLMKFIQVVELQVNDKGKRYRSSRDLTIGIMTQAVKVACKSSFRINRQTHPPLQTPDTKNIAAVYIASRIGSVNGISPVITARSFKDLFEDAQCRTFIILMDEVIKRLSLVHFLIPYYEGDIIRSIEYPYFDKDNQVICSWNMIKERSETLEESTIISAPTTKRQKIGEFVAMGIPIKNAIDTVLKEKK